MKILITGHKGQVGTAALDYGAFEDDEVVGYDIAEGDDIFDGQKLEEKMAGCGAVIHLVAHHNRETPVSDEEFFRLNVGGTKQVWRVADKLKVPRFVYVSTGNVYCAADDWFSETFQAAEPVTLDTVPAWTDPRAHAYVRTKLTCEAHLENQIDAGPGEAIALRMNFLGGYKKTNPKWKDAYLRTDSVGDFLYRACHMPLPRRFVLVDMIEPSPRFASCEEMVSILFPEGYPDRGP